MFKTNFLIAQTAHELTKAHGTPIFVYSKAVLEQQAKTMLALPAPFGLTIRYAMKANPNKEVLRIFNEQGLLIDASSGFEVEAAILAGFEPKNILLTGQQLASNFEKLVKDGVNFNATSLRQLEEYGKIFPGSHVTVRVNLGIGSGHSMKTNVGGQTSSFGIWHEYIPKIHDIAKKYRLKIHRLHTHIGSGTDSAVWQQAAQASLELIKSFPEAAIINLGGGFKVGRMDDEQGVNMVDVGKALKQELESFAKTTGRELHLELEPGTFLVANAGILIAQIDDIVDTGEDGFKFIKLNSGMNDILRPSLYGAQHPIVILNEQRVTENYVVVGHNCESGDLLTPAPGEPERLLPRTLNHADVGDLVLIGGVGAYCASMAAHNYNSYPSAAEVILK